jgi:AraC-like DNA-binding protein
VPGQELRLETESFRLLILSIPSETVTAALRARGGCWHPGAGWPGEVSLDSPAGTLLRALCRWAARELDRPGAGALAADGAKRALEQTLLMLFLDCIDGSLPASPTARETPSEAHVRRLEEWMDINVSEPVSVEDLARAAGVSVRSLQIACRRWRGCTPMDLLRRRRLDAAGEALRRAEPGATVTAVATEFGFFNFGRFAALYRDRFGETPSQTLAAPSRRQVPLAGRKTQSAVPALEE